MKNRKSRRVNKKGISKLYWLARPSARVSDWKKFHPVDITGVIMFKKYFILAFVLTAILSTFGDETEGYYNEVSSELSQCLSVFPDGLIDNSACLTNVIRFSPKNTQEIIENEIPETDIGDKQDYEVYHSSVAIRRPYLWPYGRINFVINSNVYDKMMIRKAIDHFQKYTFLRFYEGRAKNYIEFVGSNRNASKIGMMDGRQEIEIEQGQNVGTVIHEIGHAVGLEHEQCRNDRNSYIKIHWENIPEKYKSNFRITSSSEYKDIGSFDFNSIMMYDPYEFSENGKPTITRRNGSTYISQRSGLSQGDIKGIYYMYKTHFRSRRSSNSSVISNSDINYAKRNWLKIPIGTKIVFKKAFRIPAHNNSIMLVKEQHLTCRKILMLKVIPYGKDRLLKKGLVLTVTHVDLNGNVGIHLNSGDYLFLIRNCRESSDRRGGFLSALLGNPIFSDAFTLIFPHVEIY